MTDLPVNLDTTYPDDPSDPSTELHQEHHDALHALHNAIAGTAPDLASLGIAASGAYITSSAGLLSARPAASADNSGDFYFATDVDTGTLYRSNGSSWVQVSAGVDPTSMVVATADQTVNNSATLVADTELTLAVEADNTYLLDMFLIYNSSTTADMRIKLTGAGGATFSTVHWATRGAGTTAASGVNSAMNSQLRELADQAILGGIGANAVATPTGRIVIGAGSDGTLGMSFAQGTAEVSDTTRKAGSWMRLTRI